MTIYRDVLPFGVRNNVPDSAGLQDANRLALESIILLRRMRAFLPAPGESFSQSHLANLAILLHQDSLKLSRNIELWPELSPEDVHALDRAAGYSGVVEIADDTGSNAHEVTHRLCKRAADFFEEISFDSDRILAALSDPRKSVSLDLAVAGIGLEITEIARQYGRLIARLRQEVAMVLEVPASQKSLARDDAAPAHELRTLPRWDVDSKTLSNGDGANRTYGGQAFNCHAVLSEFERVGWPMRIDDPLPFKSGVDPCERVKNSAVLLPNFRMRSTANRATFLR